MAAFLSVPLDPVPQYDHCDIVWFIANFSPVFFFLFLFFYVYPVDYK